jgi:hypothetical protein
MAVVIHGVHRPSALRQRAVAVIAGLGVGANGRSLLGRGEVGAQHVGRPERLSDRDLFPCRGGKDVDLMKIREFRGLNAVLGLNVANGCRHYAQVGAFLSCRL